MINTYQKLHFAFFNIAIIDLIYFACRTLVHSNLSIFTKILAFLFISMGIYDLVEVWFKSSKVKIKLDDLLPEQNNVNF